MSALDKLVARCNEMDFFEQDNWLGDVFMPSLAQKELDQLRRVKDAAEKSLPILRRLSEIHHATHHSGDLEHCSEDTCIINRATITVLAAALEKKL